MKIILCGCNGKMGKAVIEFIKKVSTYEIVAGVDINPTPNSEFYIFKTLNEINISADVIIDFSHPSALINLLKYSKRTNIPCVLCTTGLSDSQINLIKETSKTTALFYSRNMSLGINLLLELSRKATKILGDNFDIEIIEKHHNQKIDAPSGTALMIAEEITNEKNQEFSYIFDRTKINKPRSNNEIGIHSVRGGSIAGDHEVMFAGKDEVITISHHAGSRDIFATGAVRAAEFMIGKKAGLYTMKDMIENS